jgi:hypothetical protein
MAVVLAHHGKYFSNLLGKEGIFVGTQLLLMKYTGDWIANNYDELTHVLDDNLRQTHSSCTMHKVFKINY